jgi:hypothetical protein
MEIVRVLAEGKYGLRRTVVFAAFSGEEYGLHGSEYYVTASSRMDDHVAMFNLDMIGRGPGSSCDIIGFWTSLVWQEFLGPVLQKDPIVPWLEPYGEVDIQGGGNSDYHEFHLNRVPYLYFHTGRHEDYHRITDHADKLNYETMLRITRIVTRLVCLVAQRPERPVWLKAGEVWEKLGMSLTDTSDFERALNGASPADGALRVKKSGGGRRRRPSRRPAERLRGFREHMPAVRYPGVRGVPGGSAGSDTRPGRRDRRRPGGDPGGRCR